MDRNEWISEIILSSIPLRQFNHMRQPVGFASGCLIDYSGKRMILTVAHATDNDKNWGIEVRAHENIATQVYLVGAMMFLTRRDVLNGTTEEIDFSYATVPNDLQPYHHELDGSQKIIRHVPKVIQVIDFAVRPDADKKYGFFGGTNYTTEGLLLKSEGRLVIDLKFVGEEGDYYIFLLPVKHPGHRYFRGTSGAPILDSDGKVIALVCGGCEKKHLIYGIALHPYKSALDVETMTSKVNV
jgi:hypothetical protein